MCKAAISTSISTAISTGISTGILEAKFSLSCCSALFIIPPQTWDSFGQFNKENRGCERWETSEYFVTMGSV